MRAVALAAWLLIGCGGHPGTPVTPAQHSRCVLRLSERGTFVDGQSTSRDRAVAYCKRTSGAIVVIEHGRDGEWDATRAALEREGVWFYVRGPLCYGLYRDSCGPRAPVLRIVPERPRIGTTPPRPERPPALPVQPASAPSP